MDIVTLANNQCHHGHAHKADERSIPALRMTEKRKLLAEFKGHKSGKSAGLGSLGSANNFLCRLNFLAVSFIVVSR